MSGEDKGKKRVREAQQLESRDRLDRDEGFQFSLAVAQAAEKPKAPSPLTDDEKTELLRIGQFGKNTDAETWDAMVDKIKAARDNKYPSDWYVNVNLGVLYMCNGVELGPQPRLEILEIRHPADTVREDAPVKITEGDKDSEMIPRGFIEARYEEMDKASLIKEMRDMELQLSETLKELKELKEFKERADRAFERCSSLTVKAAKKAKAGNEEAAAQVDPPSLESRSASASIGYPLPEPGRGGP